MVDHHYQYSDPGSLANEACYYNASEDYLSFINAPSSSRVVFDLQVHTISETSIPSTVINAQFDEASNTWVVLEVENIEGTNYQSVYHYDIHWQRIAEVLRVIVPIDKYSTSSSQLKKIDGRFYCAIASLDKIYYVTKAEVEDIYELPLHLSSGRAIEDCQLTSRWVWHPVTINSGRRRIVFFDRATNKSYVTSPGH